MRFWQLVIITWLSASSIVFCEEHDGPDNGRTLPRPVAPAAIAQPPIRPPVSVVLPTPITPETCRRFLGQLDIDETMKMLNLLTEHFQLFDVADEVFGRFPFGRVFNNPYEHLSLPPPLRVEVSEEGPRRRFGRWLRESTFGTVFGGAASTTREFFRPPPEVNQFDRFIARVDLDAVADHVGGPINDPSLFSSVASYFLRHLDRFDRNRDGGISYQELMDITGEASRFRMECRNNGNEIPERQRRECEEKLGEYRQARSVLNELNAPEFRERRLTLEAARLESRLKRELKSNPVCRLDSTDIHSPFRERIPAMGCMPDLSTGPDTPISTECESGECVKCEVTVRGRRIGQVCKNIDSAKLSLLLFCQYTRDTGCLNQLNSPLSCWKSQFNGSERSCRPIPSVTGFTGRDTTISIGLAPFVPLSHGQRGLAGQGGMLNLGTTASEKGLVLTRGLSFPLGENSRTACELADGSRFMTSQSEPSCKWSVESSISNRSSRGIDFLGTGATVSRHEGGRQEVHGELRLESPSGSSFEKLVMACEAWLSRQEAFIATETDRVVGSPAPQPPNPNTLPILTKLDVAPVPPSKNSNPATRPDTDFLIVNPKLADPDPRDRINPLGDRERIRRW